MCRYSALPRPMCASQTIDAPGRVAENQSFDISVGIHAENGDTGHFANLLRWSIDP